MDGVGDDQSFRSFGKDFDEAIRAFVEVERADGPGVGWHNFRNRIAIMVAHPNIEFGASSKWSLVRECHFVSAASQIRGEPDKLGCC